MIMKLPNEPKRKGYYGDNAYVEEIIEKAGRWIDTRYRQVQKYAAAKSACDGQNPIVARIFKLLAPKPYRRPVHWLDCECRKCRTTAASQQRFYQYMKRELRWGEDGHII